MKFLSIYTPKSPNSRPDPEHMAKMGQLMAESIKAGVLVATGGLLPVSMNGARVRREGGRTTVVDGPFTESKELVVGWAILETKSRDEAIELAKQFIAITGDGECELRQITEPGSTPPGR